nr:hypothetical protein [Tanacetum cinerariifolium]
LDYVLAKRVVNEFPELESVKLMMLFLHRLYPCRINHCFLNVFRFSCTHVGFDGFVEDGLFVVGGVSCCLELLVGEEDLLTLEVPALKNSSYKGPKSIFNSCCDGMLYLLKEKHFVVKEQGQSCHNLTPFVVRERGLKCH